MIISRRLLFQITKWQRVGNFPLFFSDSPNFIFSSYYNRYLIISDRCGLYYSEDLKTWKQCYGNFVYDAKNDRINKVTIAKSGTDYVLSIAKMTSLNVFDTEKVLAAVPYNTYSYGDITCAEMLGDYCIFSYYLESKTGYGSSSVTDCYQGVIYSKDSENWSVTNIYTAQGNYYQQTCLGSSGSKYVLIIATTNGFCPVLFTAPESFQINSAIWSGGNMTGAKGFYLNGVWNYASSGFSTTRNSSDGITFVSQNNEWLNKETLLYNSKYITRNLSGSSLRCYDLNFENYTEIPLPASQIVAVLGIIDNEIYIVSSSRIVYKRKLSEIGG